MKEEMWYNNEYKYETAKDLINEIHNYIKYCNETRIIAKLSPIKYRKQFLNNNTNMVEVH